MGYMHEFPHTRQFDSDLREIIEMMKPLYDFYKEYGTIILNINNEDKLFPLTVKYYGAKGNGVVDDTAAIEKAIENQEYIIFTPGTYRISSVINFKDKKVIGIGATIEVTNTAQCIYENCIIYGMKFTSTNPALTLCSATNNGSIFRDCVFNVSYIGVTVTASNTVFDSCRFYGNGSGVFGIWADTQNNPPNAINVDNCYFEKFCLNAIFGYGNPMVITNSTFIDNHLQVQPSGGGQLDLVAYDADKNYAQSIVANCRIMGGNNATTGIETENGNVLVTGCVISVPNNGISLQHTDEAIITGNYIYGCGIGVYLPTTNKCTIDGNRIMNNTRYDIRADVQLEDCVVSNNTLTQSKETSLSWGAYVFNGKVFGNVPETNNFNFATSLGDYVFKVKNNRPAILRVRSATSNVSAIYMLDGSGVHTISDHLPLLGNKFSLANDGSGNWTFSIIGETAQYMWAEVHLT